MFNRVLTLQGQIQEFLIVGGGGGPNLDSEKHYKNVFQISGKIEWLSIKKQVNQLRFRLKQVVKKKIRLGKGGGGGARQSATSFPQFVLSRAISRISSGDGGLS